MGLVRRRPSIASERWIEGPAKEPSCPVCSCGELERFLRLREVPVYCNVLWPTKAEAQGTAKGDLDLVCCCECGHIFNLAFDPTLVQYSPDYENSLHFSPHFEKYTNDLADHLVSTHNLRGKVVVDIGCGKGDFLATLCALGQNRGFGFDKSYSRQKATHTKGLDITFVPEFFSMEHGKLQADFICCRQVLEHIQEPRKFLATIRAAIDDRTETGLFFEVPNAAYTFHDLGIWDLIYEHFSYFTIDSLSALFRRAGFRVKWAGPLYSGQYIGIEAYPNTQAAAGMETTAREDLSRFRRSYYTKIEYWRSELARLAGSGKRTVVWGGGSKGITFVNLLDARLIEYIIDLNPRKHGRFVAGTGAQIVAPDFLAAYGPEAVIVMNSVYQDEIARCLASLGLSPALMVA